MLMPRMMLRLVEPPATLTADVDTETTDPDIETTERTVRALLIVEETWSGDYRWFNAEAVTWRDLPLPFMATDRTGAGHDGALLVGQITDIERLGAEVWGTIRLIDSTDPEVARLQTLIENGDLPGVSADLDQVEYEMLIPEFDVDADLPVEDGYVVIAEQPMRMRFTAARLMGATAVPFPALAEAGVDLSAALVASGLDGYVDCGCDNAPAPHPIVAAPIAPPAAWFADPALTGPTPMTVGDDGRIVGHLALWSQCHRGYDGTCVTAPRTAAAYAHFRVGELVCDDGTRVPTGPITLSTGHAGSRLSAGAAARHYDDTGTAVADVAIGEDAHGIWMAGALRPGLDGATVRALMGSDVSGDWRSIDGRLELIAVLAVNVPGFPKLRASVAVDDGDPLSLVASFGVDRPEPRRLDVERRIFDRLARQIGRDRDARVAALAARIRGGR